MFVDGCKESLGDVKTTQHKNPFVKQKSQSSLPDSSKQLRQINVDKDFKKRRKSMIQVVVGQDLSEGSNTKSPNVRISSGSLFYSQVVAQQHLQTKCNPIRNAKPAYKVCEDKQTKYIVSYAKQVRDLFEKSIQQVIIFIFFCQLCTSVNLYYLFMTQSFKCECKCCCT